MIQAMNTLLPKEGSKRRKISDAGLYIRFPAETETADDVIHVHVHCTVASVASIKKEWKKGRKNHGNIKELIQKT